MNVTKSDIDQAAKYGIVTKQQADNLWYFLSEQTAHTQSFNMVNILYYLGAMIVIGAMSWFMTIAWERFGGGSISLLAGSYLFLFVLLGSHLWFNKKNKLAGGLFITLAVCMVPLLCYGLQKWAGLWLQDNPGNYKGYYMWVKGSWLTMELSTILAGFFALKFFRFPFLTAPIAFSLWYMSMDMTPLLFGKVDFSWDERMQVSIVFGIVMLIFSFMTDRRTKQDFAFWGYLFGMLALFPALMTLLNDNELQRALFGLVSILFIVLSPLLRRHVFIIFGGLGLFCYLAHLANKVFENDLIFPVVLSAIGILFMFLAYVYQENKQKIESKLKKMLPSWLQKTLPPSG